MRIINHALTGAFIGLTIGAPVLALPLALISHFICDIIPHYGGSRPADQEIRSKFFRRLLYIDAGMGVGLVLVLAVGHPSHWWLAAVCAFLAAAPDLQSYRRFVIVNAHKAWHPNLYERFASGIQWFERPIGAVVEIAWLVAALILLRPFWV